jgi:hypothetical protein
LPVCHPVLERLSKSGIMQHLRQFIRKFVIFDWRNRRASPSELELRTAAKSSPVCAVDVSGPGFYGVGNMGQELESRSTEAERSEEVDLEGQPYLPR